jgi:hypothetical protein
MFSILLIAKIRSFFHKIFTNVCSSLEYIDFFLFALPSNFHPDFYPVNSQFLRVVFALIARYGLKFSWELLEIGETLVFCEIFQ